MTKKIHAKVPSRGQKGGNKQSNAGDSKVVPWDPRMIYSDSMTLPKVPSTLFQTLKTSTATGFLSQSSTLQTFVSKYITSGDILDFSNLAAVFDQYRIDMVEVIMNPQTTQGIPTTTFGPPKGQLYSVIDYDDATNLTTTAAADAYANVIVSSVTNPSRRCFKPRVALAVYGGAFTSFANAADQWIDCASTGVQHYGVKYACDIGTTSNTVSYDQVVRILVSFRNSR